jgi:hypothetical protein
VLGVLFALLAIFFQGELTLGSGFVFSGEIVLALADCANQSN